MAACTSLMTKEPYTYPPINTFEEFKRSNLKWIGQTGHAMTTKLLSGDHFMKSRHVYPPFATTGVPTHIKALQMLLDTPNTYIYPQHSNIDMVFDLAFMDINREHKFYISRPFGSENFVIFLRKNSVYHNLFNTNLLRLRQAGIPSKLMEDVQEQFKIMGRAQTKSQPQLVDTEVSNTIKMKHMGGTFVFLVCGLVSSLIVTLVEIIFHKLTYTRRNQRSIDLKELNGHDTISDEGAINKIQDTHQLKIPERASYGHVRQYPLMS